MKVLTLLRHAKSGWDQPGLRDFDRPLNRRGHKAAALIGRTLKAERMSFDAVIASPAVRVLETLDGVTETYGSDLAPAFHDDLYLASPAVLLDHAHRTDDAAASLLIVGHNPGLEMLALMVSGHGALADTLAEKYPTAAVAVIRFDVENWSQVAEGRGTLTRFIRPRDLDPDLGPED